MSESPPRARLEVFVEPFRESDPGPHVDAAIAAIRETGLDADMGPFATTASGDVDAVIDAVSSLLRAGFDHGADAIQLRVERSS